MNLIEALNSRRRPVEMNCAALGCAVLVRRLSYGFLVDNAAATDGGALLVKEGIVDEAGRPVFESIEAVKALDVEVLGDLVGLVSQVNNFQRAAGDAEKNSPPPPICG